MLILLLSTVHYTSIFVSIGTIIGFVFALVVAVVLVITYGKSERAKSAIDLNEKVIRAQYERINGLEQEVQRAQKLRTEDANKYTKVISELEERLRTLEISVETLQAMKSGTEAVWELSEDIKLMHQSNQEHLKKIHKDLDALRSAS